MDNSDKFSSIRAYTDADIKEVLERLMQTNSLHLALIKLVFPNLNNKVLQKTLAPFFKLYIKNRFSKIRTIEDFQKIVGNILRIVIKRTTSEVVIQGLENITAEPALFVSNHRDIAFDPALINYALYTHGFPTTRIAIGDNLLENQIVEDIMRLNKSFLVRRSIKGIKQNLLAMQLLSEYITYSITEENASVWLAQKQGRAKDGIDKTDKAVLKMLTLATKNSMSFADSVKKLNIIPVSISYEYDPCDYLKAKELAIKQATGTYTKEKGEDTASIIKGLLGYKGKVYLKFCKPLNSLQKLDANIDYGDIQKLAKYIDKSILENYELQYTNIIANDLLLDTNIAKIATKQGINIKYISNFLTRIENYSVEIRTNMLKMYANPVITKKLYK